MDVQLRSRIPAAHPLKAAVEGAIRDELRGADREWHCTVYVTSAVASWILALHRPPAPPEVILVDPNDFDAVAFRRRLRAIVGRWPPE